MDFRVSPVARSQSMASTTRALYGEMARLRSPGRNASNRRKANWVLGSAETSPLETSPEAARWGRSVLDGFRSHEKREDIRNFPSRRLRMFAGKNSTTSL